MTRPATQTRITLQKRPEASIVLGETFKIEKDVPIPQSDEEVGEGNILVEVSSLSLDPAMRGWINDTRSYIPPVQLGEVMRAGGIGKVVAGKPGKDSRGEQVDIGDQVYGLLGWQEYATISTKTLKKIKPLPTGLLVSDVLGTLGATGQTAYWGLKDVAQLKEGETVVVTGAAGAVGMVACGIAKHVYNCKVIGVAGSDEKCEWLVKDIGIDAALNYKDQDFQEKFRNTVGYLDVMFDNVGGEILDFALTQLKPHARIALCGAISGYNSEGKKGLTNYTELIKQKASLLGFIVFDYVARSEEAEQALAKWLLEGKLKRRETRVEGIENAPRGLLDIFAGKNTGKMILSLSSSG